MTCVSFRYRGGVRSPKLETELWNLLQDVDALIEFFDGEVIEHFSARLAGLRDRLRSEVIISESTGRGALARDGRLRRWLLGLLRRGERSEIERFRARDQGFIGRWGSPLHLAVFLKSGARLRS